VTGSLPPTPPEIEVARLRVDAWLDHALAENPVVDAVERAAAADLPAIGARAQWYVRVHGEDKPVFAVWFTLRQRTLHFETYVMPAPIVNQADLYEHLLRRNQKLHGIAFSIGVEDAVFLAGELPVEAVDEPTLDEALGSLYAATELCFRPAMRLGFAGSFAG